MVSNALLALSKGDLSRLWVPADSSGRRCGIDYNVTCYPNLVFFNLIKCIGRMYDCETPQVCVKQCPTTPFIFNTFLCNSDNFNDLRDKLICQIHVNVSRIRNCNEIEQRIKNDDCARWYLPSNSCKNFSYKIKYFVIETKISAFLQICNDVFRSIYLALLIWQEKIILI